MARLIAKREILAGKKEMITREVEVCREAVERYRLSVARWSKEKISRPNMDGQRPDLTLASAIGSFTNAQLKNADWAAGFNRPKAAFKMVVADPYGNQREMFDPDENPRYLGQHRENLAQLDEALEEVAQEVVKTNAELSDTNLQIQMEARRING
jgi:hypothetical protein